MYRLTLASPEDTQQALYDPITSKLTWADGSPIPLSRVGMARLPFSMGNKPFVPTDRKTTPQTVKIQLGLKCNYACTYCNQRSQPHELQGNANDAHEFLKLLPTFYDGGPSGDGTNTRFEFWGGEPFVYWKTLRILGGAIRSAYPKANFNIVTNATLLDDEKIEWLDTMGFNVGISHDGEAYGLQRGADPLLIPEQLEQIKKLYQRLRPKNRVGFNVVLTDLNFSLVAARDYIASKLGVPAHTLSYTTEEIALPYDQDGKAISPLSKERLAKLTETAFLEAARGQSQQTGSVRGKMEDFFRSIAQARPANALGQKCGMDDPTKLATDLKGNALTCQNTSALTKHKIGHVSDIGGIRLSTAHHWSTRKECPKCPVLQLCQGACLFLEDDLWKTACNSSFAYNLGLFAASLFFLTGRMLTKLEADDLHGDGPASIDVLPGTI